MKDHNSDITYQKNKEVIKSFYDEKGLINYFEKDNNYLEKSFVEIMNLWLENLKKIETVNYIMIAEAPLWGDEKKYIYNSKTKNSQFFYRSDIEDILDIKIKDKSEFINICNSIGLLILDISPFPLNPKDTVINYRKIGKNNYKKIVEATLPLYFEKKINLIKSKVSDDTKVFFRYKRVKNNFENLIGKALIENNIINSLTQIGEISQKGGGIDKSKLKEIFS